MNELAVDLSQLDSAAQRIRWWNSLAFRLGVVINITALVVMVGFWGIDNRRERSIHLESEIERLGEEAGVLRTVRSHLRDAVQFEQFVDTFCHQMDMKVSPGHHIVAFDSRGSAAVRAHARTDATLERKMAEAQYSRVSRFSHQGSEYIAVSVPDELGGKIVIAQSEQPIAQIIRAQAVSRAANLGALAVLVFAVTTIALVGWVRNPLHELVTGVSTIGRGQMDARVPLSGTRELRYLAQRVNEMAGALETLTRGMRGAKEAAEQANRAKDHLLAVLSHELRTPPTPVLATAAMLERDAALGEDARESLQVIRRNVQMGARLIDDLLDVTRIARGKLQLDRSPADLAAIIRGAVEVCRPDIDARRLHLAVDFIDGPHVIFADAARIQQVFWNRNFCPRPDLRVSGFPAETKLNLHVAHVVYLAREID